MSSTSTIATNTTELIVHLARGSGGPARSLAGRVQADLNIILSSDLETGSSLRHQALQTMYAIEEVLLQLDESNFRAACDAARDASKEWRQFRNDDDGVSK